MEILRFRFVLKVCLSPTTSRSKARQFCFDIKLKKSEEISAFERVLKLKWFGPSTHAWGLLVSHMGVYLFGWGGICLAPKNNDTIRGWCPKRCAFGHQSCPVSRRRRWIRRCSRRFTIIFPTGNAQKVTVCSALRRISVGHGGRAKVRPIVETVSHEMPAEFKRLDPIEATPRTSFEEGGYKSSADSQRSGPSPQMASGSLATRLISEFFTNRTVA